MKGVNRFIKKFNIEGFTEQEIKEVFGLVAAMTFEQMELAKRMDKEGVMSIVISEYENVFKTGEFPNWFLQILASL